LELNKKMEASVWILAQEGDLFDLESELVARGIRVGRIDEGLADAALSLYDSSGLLVVHHRHPETVDALTAGAALVPVLAVAPASLNVPSDILRIEPHLAADEMCHHVLEILSEGSQFRRYPRVPVDLRGHMDEQACQVKNASLYGVWVAGHEALQPGATVKLDVAMSDGALVHLHGRVVAARDGGIAIRTRPVGDVDLVLWLHLILGALQNSPLYGDADPYGPLFR
jgi:hypothetical protein